MNLRERVQKSLKGRRQRLLEGKMNCIPSPFERFARDFIGLEQSCYYTITSFTKGGKSQFTSYVFIFEALLYCYYHRDKEVRIKILYFPLEETPERILIRFQAWLLYRLSQGKIRISPRELRSTTKPCPEEILKRLEEADIQDILKYFEECVLFPEEAANPTGIYKYCRKYAEEHGTVYTRKVAIKGEMGEVTEREVFDRYEQDDPNEFRMILIDTLNLIDCERGMSLKQSMDKMSEYLAKYLRNRYHYSPVVIQQQAFEQEGNEAFKLGKMRPSVAGLGDSKYTSRDANVVLGLFSPARFGIANYLGYDITKFKDKIRFLEVIVNRDGEMGGVCPLFFDGAVCDFKELPRPENKEALSKWYQYIVSITNEKAKAFFTKIIKNIRNGKLRNSIRQEWNW